MTATFQKRHEYFGEGATVGVSVGTVENAEVAIKGADYFSTGPVFPTGKKSDADGRIFSC